MKKLIILILLFVFILSFQKAKSCTFAGGEIYWECLTDADTNSGKFVFSLVLYKDCRTTASLSQTEQLISGSPAGIITLHLDSTMIEDISPSCNNYAGFSHISCANALSNDFFKGAVKKVVYHSMPVKITGAPPLNGWMFYWGGCCRNSSTNAFIESYRLRAVMYPHIVNGYQHLSVFPCFDSSPTFAEKPETAITTGYDFSYGFSAFDKDFDSLSYEWGVPLKSNGQNISYAYGYSYTNPFPDTAKNINNIPAVLNPVTGLISLKSYTSGSFITCVKVTSYRCGEKIAEIWRDVHLALLDSVSNLPPAIVPPFSGGTSFDTIVQAGSLVHFNCQATDFQLLPNSSPTTVFLSHSSQQFGNYIPSSGGNQSTLNSMSGCKNPPCATLTPAGNSAFPLSAPYGILSSFSWQTECNHVLHNDSCNSNSDTTYYHFIITVRDDFCPVPAVNRKVVTIGVTGDFSYLPPPIIDSAYFDYNTGEAHISWLPVVDSLNKFLAYHIYYSSVSNGNYILLDSVKNVNTTSYIHSLGQIANSFYKIRTLSKNSCGEIDTSAFSGMISLDLTGMNRVRKRDFIILYPNEPNPAKTFTNIRFYVKESPEINLILYDFTGRIIDFRIIETKPGINRYKLLLNKLSDGIYYYSIICNNQKLTGKIVVQGNN